METAAPMLIAMASPRSSKRGIVPGHQLGAARREGSQTLSPRSGRVRGPARVKAIKRRTPVPAIDPDLICRLLRSDSVPPASATQSRGAVRPSCCMSPVRARRRRGSFVPFVRFAPGAQLKPQFRASSGSEEGRSGRPWPRIGPAADTESSSRSSILLSLSCRPKPLCLPHDGPDRDGEPRGRAGAGQIPARTDCLPRRDPHSTSEGPSSEAARRRAR